MASPGQRGNTLVGFKRIQLLKGQTLGIGSYGKVCKAKCDDLLCAAKLIHETLFDPTAHQLIAPQREHRLPMRRFEQECDFLSTIKHPNIVQYLGIYRDPDTDLPALLMELMDDSLTHFLESSTQPIHYHIQVNICHDITLALSFLHSNNLVHRDLSTNNVLLIGNVRAKVTDFGMARLGDQLSQATNLSFTMCPGTDVYMPPEAVQDRPVYTEKIDCFSFGVITLQILTRQFPKPGDRRKEIEIDQSGIRTGTIAEIRVPEIERRQNHISLIDPKHTLLHIFLDCLKDREFERPSAQQLCERVAVLKESPEYTESIRDVQEGNTPEQDRGDERKREIKLRHAQQIQGLQQIIQSQLFRLEEKDQALREKHETIALERQQIREQLDHIRRLEREKDEMSERLERELARLNRQLEDSGQISTQFQRRIADLEQLVLTTDATPRSKEQSSSSIAWIKMTWREGRKAPCRMSTIYSTVTDGISLYTRTGDKEVFAFTASISSWSQLPDSPTHSCPSVIVNNLLTLVGGYLGSTITNSLFSLTGIGSGMKWIKKFPAMPTKRQGSTALSTGTALIIAGGARGVIQYALRTVEIMNTETLQWSTAADLPQPQCRVPGAVCDDKVFILSLKSHSKSMYTCPISTLIDSCKSKSKSSLWTKVPAPPVTGTTCVCILGRLLTIGGRDLNDKLTGTVYVYNPTTNFWEVLSQMLKPRCQCFSVVLPNNQLMVVGGVTDSGETDSVEVATVERELT